LLPVLAWLGVILRLVSVLPEDPPILTTPHACHRDGYTRTRGLRAGDHDVMGLRSCSRRLQGMGLAIHGDYRWWLYGRQFVSGLSHDIELQLRRHVLVRGTLADGAPAIAQVLEVMRTQPTAPRDLSQTITVCSLPVASRVRCGTITNQCAGACPGISLVRGVLRAGKRELATLD
jgi:hypothetical protein